MQIRRELAGLPGGLALRSAKAQAAKETEESTQRIEETFSKGEVLWESGGVYYSA
jgi:hypothetical protein